MRYPIPARWRGWLFWIMAGLTLIISRLMRGPLRTSVAPWGIVSFELAGSPAKARTILASWDAQARQHALFSVRLDFLFIIAYSTLLSLACVWVAERLRARNGSSRLVRIGWSLAWLQWLAGLFDAVENIALLRMLGGAVAQPWPRIAQVCAVIKFALLLGGAVFTVFGGFKGLRSR